MYETMTLRDGRTIEYADLGDPSGRPTLFFHGTPATAGQAAVIADAAHREGVRLVAMSRPGYGASTPSPRSLAGTAADALELANHLDLEQFAVMGGSGGAPFALAVAARSPEWVTSVAVHAGPGQYAELMPENLDEHDRRAIELLADGDVDGAVALMTEAADAAFGDLRGLSAEDFHVAFQRTRPPGPSWFDRHPDLLGAFETDWQRGITTFDGFVRDNLSWLGTWDIDLAAITAPVRLVYAEDDGMVPPAHGEWLRERLASSQWHVIPGGHSDAIFGAAADSFAVLGAG